MAGDRETAVSIMRMDEGLDTGPVCLEEWVPIPSTMTAGTLHDELALRGARLMVQALAALELGNLECRPQPADGATYAAKIDKTEACIDWSRPAQAVHDHMRGLSPFPGAWFEAEAGGKSERIKVLLSEVASGSGNPGEVISDDLTVACGNGAVRLLALQRAGKKQMTASELLRGFALPAGTRLGRSGSR